MSELALAAFAAETGTHVVGTPRDRRWRSVPALVRRGALRRRTARRADSAGSDGRSRASRPLLAADPRSAARTVPARCRHGRAARSARPSPSSAPARARPTARRSPGRAGGSWRRPGLVVISGLARGIDGEAHRGALEAGGVTVAVLGCGVDRDYPASHRELAARVGERGLIVSEYAPGVEPAPWRFPARNRIVAGLARATVVVEARERSGALITADFALEQGREVFAVPGEITSTLSAGTNALLGPRRDAVHLAAGRARRARHRARRGAGARPRPRCGAGARAPARVRRRRRRAAALDRARSGRALPPR